MPYGLKRVCKQFRCGGGARDRAYWVDPGHLAKLKTIIANRATPVTAPLEERINQSGVTSTGSLLIDSPNAANPAENLANRFEATQGLGGGGAQDRHRLFRRPK